MLLIELIGDYIRHKNSLATFIKYLVNDNLKINVLLYEPFTSIDQNKKDTSSHQAAGAAITIAASPNKHVVLGKRHKNKKLNDDLIFFNKSDLTLVCGYSETQFDYTLKLNNIGELDFSINNNTSPLNCDDEKIINLINKNISGVNQ